MPFYSISINFAKRPNYFATGNSGALPSRPGAGFGEPAWAIVARGRMELSAEPAWVRDVMLRELTKAVGAEQAATSIDGASRDRTIVSLRPDAWLTWDFSKLYPLT